MVCGSITEREKYFSLFYMVQTLQDTIFSPDIKNEWSHIYTPLYTSIMFIRDNISFLVKVPSPRERSMCNIFFNSDQASLIAVLIITNYAGHKLMLLTL
jgi:hypothetical protein